MKKVLIGIGVAILLAVAGRGYWAYQQVKSNEQQAFPSLNYEQNTSIASLVDTNIPTVKNKIDMKVIKCNPKKYDTKFFIEQKPCVSDMSLVDEERQSRAIKIAEVANLQGQPNMYLATLHVSDKQYQLLDVNMGVKIGYLIVDTINEKVTDFIVLSSASIIQIDDKRIISYSSLPNNPNSLTQYIYGTEKLVFIPDTEIKEPMTYLDGQSLEVDNGVKVLASSTDSITLGIYDKNEAIKKPEIYWISYKQIGTKVINLR